MKFIYNLSTIAWLTSAHHVIEELINYRNFPTADQQQTIQEFYLAVICVIGGVKIWEFHQQKVF